MEMGTERPKRNMNLPECYWETDSDDPSIKICPGDQLHENASPVKSPTTVHSTVNMKRRFKDVQKQYETKKKLREKGVDVQPKRSVVVSNEIFQNPPLAPSSSSSMENNGGSSVASRNMQTSPDVIPQLNQVQETFPQLENQQIKNEVVVVSSIADYFEKLQQNLVDITKELRTINMKLDGQDKEIQNLKTQLSRLEGMDEMPCKPPFLPINTLTELENIDHNHLKSLVTYFRFLGGESVEDAMNNMVKETFTDEFTYKITWSGKNNSIKLENHKILKAFYGGLTNARFAKPTALQFRNSVSEAIRNAKQRFRNHVLKMATKETPSEDLIQFLEN